MATASQEGLPARLAIRTPTVAVALAVFVFLLLLALAGLLVAQSYRDALARAEDTARTGAHTVSAHVQWLMEAGRQSLRRVDERLGDTVPGRGDGVAADLNAAVEALPGQMIMRVYDAAGTLTNSSERDRPPSGIAATPYFGRLKDGEEWVVTPLMTDGTTGEKVFAVGRRLERAGRFEGAAVLYVPALIMADFWASLALGPNSTVSVVGDDGWLVARFPVPAEATNLKDYALFTTYLPQSPVGSYRAVSPNDGVSRLVGYRRVEGAPLIALASVSTDYALAEFRRQLIQGLMALLPAFLLLAGSVVWVLRLLARDERNRKRLADAIAQNQLLFREIHHRVKNNLQAVSSLVQLQPISGEAKAGMRARINAMAAVHEHIYNSDSFSSVNAGEYIEKLATGLSAGAEGNVRIETAAEAVALDPDDAMSLGLIVNEVVSNALKHGFPEGRRGAVRIAFCLNAEGTRAVLSVRDDGVGFAADPPSAASPAGGGSGAANGQAAAPRGMGLRLIRGLAERLNAEWAFRRANGTAFELSFPLQRLPA